MKTFLSLAVIIIISTNLVSAQTWVQTPSTPIGGGVTDLLVRENGDILATVGSFNWPSVAGGIRKSTDDGQTWQNVASAFNGRTIEEAFDGNLYASIWFFPQNEALYRSTDGGTVWLTAGYSVPSGNNIFSIAIKPGNPDYSIFLGTRNGIVRSTNSGSNFQSANTGIPANSWVRDIEIDSLGNIAAATTNGVFISTNNGDQWQPVTGISSEDTIVTLKFDYPLSTQDGGSTSLYLGSDKGSLYKSFADNVYLTATLLAVFGNGEISTDWVGVLQILNEKLHGVAVFPKEENVGGVYVSTEPAAGFVKQNNGLPLNPKVSALSGRVVQNRNDEHVELYAGLYENQSGGAKIFKRIFVVSVDELNSSIPDKFMLNQNYPNPFNPGTRISWQLPVGGNTVLKVFDVIGKEITTLVDEYKPAGSYEVEFNASGLSSGVYYYRVITGEYIQTRKMIILR